VRDSGVKVYITIDEDRGMTIPREEGRGRTYMLKVHRKQLY
jgi:hypothetical protein